jgi:hypothetical protein
MTKKQTAIQWFASELSGHLGPSNGPELLAMFQQALAIEKEQIKHSFDEGEHWKWHPEDGYYRKFETADQYYEKTFRGVDD